MNEFKIGDKLRLKFDGLGPNVPANSVLTCIEDDEPVDGFRLSGEEVSIRWANSHKDYFELITGKESTAKWLKENAWFIRTGSPEKSFAVQEWLFDHGMEWHNGEQAFFNYKEQYLGNVGDTFGTSGGAGKEVTLEFETIVKSFTLPAVETEQEKKIRELQETIDKASAQIKAIKEGM